ncbi:hypothetical protein HNE_1339 [Hyphomonas neptunium ATCC 15444]|uniref:Uncharacterized protein n=2 Tax=Hyphomonas TaxID=85 RepID=Q0C2I6_HYPNA|nr:MULTISPECIES: hypothetical protein [Hyphomonas]ABI75803.1 hypothetical protein HNE_1339 [Hyphomonas neptunium ATCC 15444]KCZ95708.1 hypothetical protein HHI_03017 [Hyphomonas hirschiana VP5]
MSNSKKPDKEETQADIAQRALDMKTRAAEEDTSSIPESRTAGEGQIQEARAGEPPMGALDAEGHRPVLERSRKVR